MITDFEGNLDWFLGDDDIDMPKPECEGYSADEMVELLIEPFLEGSPILLHLLSDKDYELIPLFRMVKYLAEVIQQKGEIKLTQKGYLPVKVSEEFYNQGFIKSKYIDLGWIKQIKEANCPGLSFTRIMLDLMRMVKKRHNKLSLTKSGERLLLDKPEMLMQLFLAYVDGYNWAYTDSYGNNSIGQIGYAFSLILLSKYGDEKRPADFYAEKYFKAFPMLSNAPIYAFDGSYIENLYNCYIERFFEMFLDKFGLVELEMPERFEKGITYVKKTDLFDRLFFISPPRPTLSKFELN